MDLFLFDRETAAWRPVGVASFVARREG